ncbi:MAG TPA: GAF domain-containing protein [Solirubrobacteraceae bacterium]|jgi:GAF domain-containing protein|nr:GAF domain-containing protein [Solirubrobacteraceae bacterium]
MRSAFDHALDNHELRAAAQAHASRYGQRGSEAYRLAWLRFRHEVQTIDDLRNRRLGHTERSADVVEVLNGAVARAMAIDGAPMGHAHLVEPRTRALRMVLHSGFTTDFVDFFGVTDDSASAMALATGQPVWVPDVMRSTVFADTPALAIMLGAGSRAVASLPLTSRRGATLAIISTHHKRRRGWTNDRRLELEGLARSTARMLDRAIDAGDSVV